MADVRRVEAEVCVRRSANMLSEGSIWDARSGRLLWLDIPSAMLFRLDPVTGENEEYDLSARSPFVTSVVPLCEEEDPSGDRVGITLGHGFAVYNFKTKEVTELPGAPPLAERERFNDGKVDPAGRYWAGTFSKDEQLQPVAKAALYRRNHSGTVDRVFDGVSISNGIIWTKDASTMYYIDTPQCRVDAFDFDASSGEISNRRVAVSGFGGDAGYPDGCTIDAEGMLWVARYNSGCAGRYNPATGELLMEACVPEAAGKQVTSVAFGGDGLGDLYLTTAHEGCSAEEAAAAGVPLAGSLFRVPREVLQSLGAAPGQLPNMLRLAQ